MRCSLNISRIAGALLRRFRKGQVGLAAGCLLLSACAGNDGPALHPVHGQVRYRGRPVAGAFVILHPDAAPADGLTAKPFGTTDAEGRFTLSTHAPGDGAAPGRYAVTVEWRTPDPADESLEGPNRLPERYGKPTTSGLAAEIAAEPNEVALNLK